MDVKTVCVEPSNYCVNTTSLDNRTITLDRVVLKAVYPEMLTSKNLTLLQHISAIVVDNIVVTLSRIFFSPEAFCDTEKVLNRRLQPGIRPRTRLRSSRRCSRLPSGLGKGHPSPIPTPPRRLPHLDIGAFGASFQ